MSSSLPRSKPILWLALLLIVVQFSGVAGHGNDINKERTHDGPVSPSQRNEDHSFFEHSSILGSRKEIEQFEDLSPEEAKERLRGLAKKMDFDKDGNVDKDELKKWILNSFASLSMEEATERFEDADRNGDKLVSWEEHLSESFGDGTITYKTQQEKKERETLIDEERELFDLADKDKNRLLTLEEYARVSQPQDHPEMHKLVVTHVFRRKDTDKDGKISMEEFLKDEKLTKENLLEERERFEHELDKNKDSVVDMDELHQWVIPDNNDIANQEVEHLLDLADDNGDGKLTIAEIVNHHQVFVNSEATDFGEHLVRYKDEL